MKRTKLLPRSKNPRKQAHRRAWEAISLYIRLSNADYRGMVKCFTCDAVMHYKEADCGHFIHGNNMDFVFENLHPQCTKCNRYLSGNEVEYTVRMIKLYGQEIVDMLMQQKHFIVKYRLQDFLDIEARYKQKVQELAGLERFENEGDNG